MLILLHSLYYHICPWFDFCKQRMTCLKAAHSVVHQQCLNQRGSATAGFFSFWFYCQTDFGSRLPSAEAYNPHQMFHITQCEKPPIPQILFYKSTHPRKLDISYFILVCGCHCKWTPVHMQLPDCCLWSAWPWLIADGEQMKEISRDFMGIATMAWVARASY